jgi:ferredoxin-NADP reductase
MQEIDAAALGAAQPARLPWRVARVLDIIDETPRVRSLLLDVPGWPGHLPGQHVDVRLTGEDGYQAQRSYSIASAPETPQLMLTIERIGEGEVSPYLTEEVRPGDLFELRGPIGLYFVWTASRGGPLLLVAGGSGIAPLMAMLRHRAAAGSRVPALLLYSSRGADDIIYREEIDRLARADRSLRVAHTLTRAHPMGWIGLSRRIDREMLATLTWGRDWPQIFVCGPSGLVETASRALVSLGFDPATIKTERFGPTGP